MYKTHTVVSCVARMLAQTVKLAGWVHRYRDHGGFDFVDCEMFMVFVQVVADPNSSPEPHKFYRCALPSG